MTIPKPILRYWLAMNASALDSAVHAIAIYCGVAGASAVGTELALLNVNPLTLKQAALVFTVAFGRAVLAYLSANPVEKLFPAATKP